MERKRSEAHAVAPAGVHVAVVWDSATRTSITSAPPGAAPGSSRTPATMESDLVVGLSAGLKFWKVSCRRLTIASGEASIPGMQELSTTGWVAVGAGLGYLCGPVSQALVSGGRTVDPSRSRPVLV